MTHPSKIRRAAFGFGACLCITLTAPDASASTLAPGEIPVKCWSNYGISNEPHTLHCTSGLTKGGQLSGWQTPPAGYALLVTDVRGSPFVAQADVAEVVPWSLRFFASDKRNYKKPAEISAVDEFTLRGQSRYETWLRPMGVVLVVPAGKYLTAIGEAAGGVGTVNTLVLGVLVKASTLSEPVPFVSYAPLPKPLPKPQIPTFVPKPATPMIQAAEVP